MNLRIDDVFADVLERLGPGWLAIAVLLMMFVTFAPLQRSLAAVAVMLLLTQVWWAPAYFISRWFRWWFLGIVAVRGLLHVLRTQGSTGPPPPRSPLLLAALAVASCAWSDNTTFSLSIAASFALGMVIVFVVLWRLLDGIPNLDGLFRPVLVFNFVAFSLGFVVGWLADLAWDPLLLHQTGWGGRYSGVFYNPNMAGLLGAISFPVILAAPRAALGSVAWMRWPTVALIVVTVVLSGSRSALIGCALALALIGLRRFGIGAVFAFVILLVGAFATASSLPLDVLDEGVLGRIARTRSVGTLSGRTELWAEGWDAAQDALGFGHGWAASRAIGGVDVEAALEQATVKDATNLHNAHLQLLVDLGFVGLGIFWWYCLRLVLAGLQLLRSARDPRTTLPLLLFASSMALLADSFVHGGVFSVGSPSSLVFWCFGAVTLREAGRVREAAVRRDADARRPAPVGLPSP